MTIIKYRNSVIYGNDLSKELLDITNKKSVYSDLLQLDSMNVTPYPYEDNTFDAITCIGTLTYCKNFPKLFNEWIRISKPGAVIIATHRSDMMKKDKTFFNGFVATLKWKKLSHIVGQPYLPNNSNYSKNISVEYWIARNTKNMSKL